MKMPILNLIFACILFITGCTQIKNKPDKFDFTGAKDPSLIRGFNYTPANVASPRHHVDTWVKFDTATIKFDLDLAKKLNLNQVRIFVPYAVYNEDKENLPAKLKLFIHECDKRGIGVMPVVGSGPWQRDTTQRALGKEWVQFLVNAISDEPGLVMWDVMNEPDWPTEPEERPYPNPPPSETSSAYQIVETPEPPTFPVPAQFIPKAI